MVHSVLLISDAEAKITVCKLTIRLELRACLSQGSAYENID